MAVIVGSADQQGRKAVSRAAQRDPRFTIFAGDCALAYRLPQVLLFPRFPPMFQCQTTRSSQVNGHFAKSGQRITRGGEDVVVAIIDSGVNYLHEDLRE